MNKKAQMQQVFIYVTAILVIGFLVLFGYRMIDRLIEQKCQVQQQQFYTKIGQDVDRSTRYGSVTEAILTRPCEYTTVCFVNTKNVTDGDTIHSPYDIININTEDKIKYNVYLIKEGPNPTVEPILFEERITTYNKGQGSDYVCVENTNGQFVFWLEGLGKNGVYLYTT